LFVSRRNWTAAACGLSYAEGGSKLKAVESKPGSQRARQLTQPAAFQTGGQGEYLRIYKSDVFVCDLDQSVKFYVDQLGLTVLADGGFEIDRWVVIASSDGNTILVLTAPKAGCANYELIGRATHIGFIAEDVHAIYQLWLSRGVHFHHPPQRQVWGGAFTVFCDVDGNSFELIESDEISHDIEVQRRAIAEKAENERRAARELEIAKQVQERLLPHTLPALKTLDYAGICIQARQVGGDYYDFVALGEQTLGLVIGDISGKGIAAALLMANLQANLRSQFAVAREQPSRFLQAVNQLFYDGLLCRIW
jgi:catechol 2,3-dioxygenase-like lactoylglutathione lyase family enzyme